MSVQISSNATVEWGLSTLRRHLHDARLSLSNKGLNELVIVRINTSILQKLDPSYDVKLVQKSVMMYLESLEFRRGRYHKTTTSSLSQVQPAALSWNQHTCFCQYPENDNLSEVGKEECYGLPFQFFPRSALVMLISSYWDNDNDHLSKEGKGILLRRTFAIVINSPLSFSQDLYWWPDLLLYMYNKHELISSQRVMLFSLY